MGHGTFKVRYHEQSDVVVRSKWLKFELFKNLHSYCEIGFPQNLMYF